MSSAEKRHFHQTVRGGKDAKYVQLFTSIAKQKVYQEDILIKKFGYEDSPNNFAAAKNQLFKLVLKSLREFSSHVSDYQKILRYLKNIEILESRGLSAEALKATKKAKVMALQNDWGIFILLTEHWEQMLSSSSEFPVEPIIPSLGHSIDIRQQYKLLYKRISHDNLLYSSFNYQRSPNHCYPEIVGHELMQDDSNLTCETARWYFCLIKIECCRSLRHTAESSKWAKKMLRVQQCMKSNGFYNKGWKLKGVYEYLLALLENYEIDQLLKDFHLIKDLECPAHRTDLLLAKTRDTLVLETYFLIISDKSKKTLKQLVKDVEEYFFKINKAHLHNNDLILIAGLQYLFYASRQDDMSVKWAVLFEQYADRKIHIKNYIGSKVMSLLSHYGLGNDIYIRNTLPTLERFIKKHNRLNSEYVFLFRALNKLLDAQTKKERESLLRDFKSDMKALQKTNRKNHLLSAQSLMVWADNCLNNKAFLDINRQLFAPDLP